LIEPLVARTFLATLGPMFAAIATIRLIRGGRLRHQPRLSAAGYLALVKEGLLGAAIMIPLLVAGLALGLLTKQVHLGPSGARNIFSSGLPWPPILLFYMICAHGEEYGWRGYLVHRLLALGAARAAVLIGVIVALWHLPAILVDGFDYPSQRPVGVLVMAAFLIPFSLIATWLRLRSGTVAAATGAHVALNLFAAALVSGTTFSSALIGGPVGLLTAVPFSIAAAYLVVSGRLQQAVTGGRWRQLERRLSTLPPEPSPLLTKA
jgi:membrane protease YdiL (CAAX protease family)